MIYKTVYFIINKYISEKTNIFIERTSKEIIEICEKNNINEDIVKKLKIILERSDAVRYSMISSIDLNKDILSLQKILKKMDKLWL